MSTTTRGIRIDNVSTVDAVNEPEAGPSSLVYMAVAVASLVFVTLIVMCVIFGRQIRDDCLFRKPADPKPEIFDEEDDNNAEEDDDLGDQQVKFPNYWTNRDAMSESCSSFNQMVFVSTEKLPQFGELLNKTYKAKATQDRPCPKKIHPRTPGGCRCVQVGGDPGLPRGYKVRRAIRIEDSNLWRRYLRKRDQIRKKRGDGLEVPDRPVATDKITNQYRDTFEPLAADLNEVYIWHGTPVRRALSIAQDSFKIDLAGTARGTMYGPGAYLAESSTKADEYAQDDPDGYYDGIFAMLLCRACMGRFYHTTDKDENAHEKIKSGEFDSTCGDREKSANTFREFVVYNAEQLYPEYVVLYTRITSKTDDLSKLDGNLLAPFQMQVPVYWRNCHHDPYYEPFHEQYIVRKSTKDLLQRLVNDSLVSDWAKVSILKARRVENSSTWSKYVKFKSILQESLRQTPGRFAKPQELVDGNQSRLPNTQKIGFSTFVVTHAHLQRENLEQVISLDHLDEPLNEYILWHGTDKAAAEAIAHDDFRIQWTGRQRHGSRYGPGIYLSDNLSKALRYTHGSEAVESEGILVRHVLLCRMLCGEMYYTEAEEGSDITEKCKQSGTSSVFVNPLRKETSEFIAVTEEQVYPEYILELQIEPHKSLASKSETDASHTEHSTKTLLPETIGIRDTSFDEPAPFDLEPGESWV